MKFESFNLRSFRSLSLVYCLLLFLPAVAETSSAITVDLKLDTADFVVGERLRAVVDVMNVSPERIDVGRANSPDRFLIEVFRAGDRSQLEPSNSRPFVAAFTLNPNEGQKLETFLSDRFALATPNHYLVRPVLVHGGLRYEGRMRAFDVVPGIKVTSALQMFANREGLRREFELVCWRRAGADHLFLTARDAGASDRRWHTVDLGQLMKVTKPTVSVMPGGEVIVIQRTDPDNFIRSEFWSVPEALEFHRRELIQDPETAGSNRVRELYKDSGGIKPKVNPWWKFW